MSKNMSFYSLVEGEHPVTNAAPEGSDSPETPEASMVIMNPFNHVLVSTVAEGSISWKFAIAELVIAWFWDIKIHWSASSQDPLALTVAEWRILSVTAWAPVVDLSSVEIDVSGEYTCICR